MSKRTLDPLEAVAEARRHLPAARNWASPAPHPPTSVEIGAEHVRELVKQIDRLTVVVEQLVEQAAGGKT